MNRGMQSYVVSRDGEGCKKKGREQQALLVWKESTILTEFPCLHRIRNLARQAF